MKFSERMGFESEQSVLQIDGMSTDLRNSLWNFLHELCNFESYISTTNIAKCIWSEFFHLPIDELNIDTCRFAGREIKQYFMSAPWYTIYNLESVN